MRGVCKVFFYQSLIIFFVFLSLSGCEQITSSDGDEVGRLTLSIRQHLSYDNPTPPDIKLHLITEEIYSCCNYSIIHDFYQSGSVLNLAIESIYKPDVCLTALGPATATIPLELDIGNYTLRIEKNRSIDIYSVKVTEDAIYLRPKDANFTSAEFSFTNLIPEKSMVYLCGTLTEDKWICQDFLDTLRKKIELQEITFPETGSLVFPQQSMGHYYDMPAKYFIYNKESDFNTAGAVLTDYTQKILSNKSGVGITLTNWLGESFRSWMMNE